MRRKKSENTENVEQVYTHRDYYAVGRKHEPIDVIQDWDLDFCLGNVVKYISRAGRKDNVDAVDDLKKAKTYLEYEISKITDEYFPTDGTK